MQNTLFVVDTSEPLEAGVHSISFNDYLKEYPKRNEPKMRVINLCDTTGYLSQGYYCSLLAEARNHQVIPSVKVINELRSDGASITSEWVMPWTIIDSDVSCRLPTIQCIACAK